MPRRPARFTQADINRAARAARDLRAAVEIKPDGTILIRTDQEPGENNPQQSTGGFEPELEVVL